MKLKLYRNPPLIHPFLILLSIFMGFVGQNLNWLRPLTIINEIVLVGIIGAAIFPAFKFLSRLDWLKAGILYSCLMFLFFSLADAAVLVNVFRASPMFGSHGGMLGIENVMFWVMLAYIPIVGLCVFLVRGMIAAEITIATHVLNLLTIGSIAYWTMQSYERTVEMQQGVEKVAGKFNIVQKTASQSENKPDIYFVILDGCASQRVFKDVYGYDNSAYIKKLQELGFYVAADSHSNYLHTHPSVSATLNCAYLESLGDVDCSSNVTRTVFAQLICDNAFARFLRQFGYKYYLVSNQDAGMDTCASADKIFRGAASNDLIPTFLSNSPIRFLDRIVPLTYTPLKQAITGGFDQVNEIIGAPGPKFLYMHVNSPHPPYLFDAEGNRSKYPSIDYYGESWAIKDGYVDSEKYLEKRVIPFVETIIKNSPRPPIIVLQGDHGPAAHFIVDNCLADPHTLRVRAEIFNAIYLPPSAASEKPASPLYQNIGPVNTMRLVLGKYFGADLPLLPERTFISNYNSLHKYEDCTETVNKVALPDQSAPKSAVPGSSGQDANQRQQW